MLEAYQRRLCFPLLLILSPFLWLHYANLCKVVFITWYVVGLFTLKLLTGE